MAADTIVIETDFTEPASVTALDTVGYVLNISKNSSVATSELIFS